MVFVKKSIPFAILFVSIFVELCRWLFKPDQKYIYIGGGDAGDSHRHRDTW